MHVLTLLIQFINLYTRPYMCVCVLLSVVRVGDLLRPRVPVYKDSADVYINFSVTRLPLASQCILFYLRELRAKSTIRHHLCYYPSGA